MILRTALRDDVSELITLAQIAIRKDCSNDYTKEQIEVWVNRINRPSRFKEAIKNQYFLVAVIENEIAGFGTLLKGNYIDFLYVSPKYARKGVATNIYKNLNEKAKLEGQKIITSDVSLTALPFFIKHGFAIITEQKNQLETEVLNNFKMELKL